MRPGEARAEPLAQLEAISRLLDSGRVVEAPVFAPKTWDAAQKALARARTLKDKGGADKELQKQLDLAVGQARQALSVTAVSRQELAATLPLRTRAREAKAQFIVPAEYMRAEDQFTSATRKIEAGDVPGGQIEAVRAEPLYDVAELAALHKTVLGTADSLLSQAKSVGADHNAPATFARAQEHRARAYELVAADRYRRDQAEGEASRAEYEARHAMQLSLAIQNLEQSRKTSEDLFLDFEADLRKVAKSAGVGQPGFDRGLKVATDSLSAQVGALSEDLTAAGSELTDVSTVLSKALAETGESSPSSHPVELASQAALRLARLTEEKADWARMAKARQAQLAEATQLADETAFELAQRREREDKFKAAQQVLTVSEGAVLYNERDDIVLRLTGLSFDPGGSDLLPRHNQILAKVEEILRQYPGHHIVVEGHTDARGSKAGNVALSEKRALAVKDRLIQKLVLDPEIIEAKGHGDEQPVASNSTADGRARNRRIDIVILK